MKQLFLFGNELAKRLRLCALVTAFSLLLMGGAEAQTTQNSNLVTLRLNSVSLVQLFDAIESQNGYSFIWDEKLNSKLQHRVSVDVVKVPIEQVLSSKLSGTGLTFKIIEKQVVIKAEQQVAPVSSKSNEVSGVVISSTDNKPILGVSVYVDGTTVGTLTDEQGRYNLAVPAGTTEVCFSYMGFEDKTIPLSQPLLFSLVTLIVFPNHYCLLRMFMVDAFCQ